MHAPLAPVQTRVRSRVVRVGSGHRPDEPEDEQEEAPVEGGKVITLSRDLAGGRVRTQAAAGREGRAEREERRGEEGKGGRGRRREGGLHWQATWLRVYRDKLPGPCREKLLRPCLSPWLARSRGTRRRQCSAHVGAANEGWAHDLLLAADFIRSPSAHDDGNE